MNISYIIFLYHIPSCYSSSPTTGVQNERGEGGESGLFPGRNFPKEDQSSSVLLPKFLFGDMKLAKCSFQGKEFETTENVEKFKEALA